MPKRWEPKQRRSRANYDPAFGELASVRRKPSTRTGVGSTVFDVRLVQCRVVSGVVRINCMAGPPRDPGGRATGGVYTNFVTAGMILPQVGGRVSHFDVS